MKAILLPVIAIVIWCAVSIFYVRFFKAKGYRVWLSRIGGICGGMVAALIFLIIFIPKNEKEKQEKTIVKEDVSAEVQQPDKKQSLDTKPPAEANAPTVVIQPQPVPEQSNNNNSPLSLAENVKPSTPSEPQGAISLDEAKSLAGALNDFMEKMERLTLTGVETDDLRGIKDYVSIPLKKVRQHFDDKFVGGTKPEPIALFLVCSDAAMNLQHYVDDILDLKPGVYKAQRLEQDLNLYSKNKEDCALLVNESDKKTNSRWKVRMQEYKKLVDSLGGEDCFTVYTVDGTAPKPAHCKK
ncbi:hypothetical protein ACFJLW_002111 [Salmonella enterica]|nr:hypothetical protein [Salmonella enterica]EEJ1459355.1 hypothetical protein [Salmonella enterica subsp. enterica serovar Virginia]EIE2770081.1 hypothetical protein [Salmonella enterica subsp. enterica serovar Rubislaw]EKB3329120.1 hypothetical protein [Salmonella enterica subsp. enterica serovar Chandans]HAE9564359.1 hypothetical protein [Salmonella enterica subsp. enterica serovar Montevideo]